MRKRSEAHKLTSGKLHGKVKLMSVKEKRGSEEMRAEVTKRGRLMLTRGRLDQQEVRRSKGYGRGKSIIKRGSHVSPIQSGEKRARKGDMS